MSLVQTARALLVISVLETYLVKAAAESTTMVAEAADQEDTQITPGDYKQFVIDFDKAASERYTELYAYFKEPLLAMEDYWWNEFYTDQIRQWFADNIEGLKEAQPDNYASNLALAQALDLDVVQTFGVSSVTELSTYCTSIVARSSDGVITHVRNLDFKDTKIMKQLIYEAVLVKDGEKKAISPSLVGFYGAYTGRVPGKFSVSYDVRERLEGPTHDVIMANLERNLETSRKPQGTIILDLLLEVESFDEAVEGLKTRKMTSPGHFIVGGTSGNEGAIISRDEDNTVHTEVLSEDTWFIAMTNVDVWEQKDSRYENAVKYMGELGQENVHPDGQLIIENVLWHEGVIQADSIFSAAISADKNTREAIYDAPSHPTDFTQASESGQEEWHQAQFLQ